MQTRDAAIQPGWDVYGADDQKVGTIQDVGPNYLRIEKGLLFITDIYVPTRAVESVDPGNGRVYLNLAKGDIDAQGWTNPPEDTEEWEGWAARRGQATSMPGDGTAVQGQDTARMSLHEEELQARTRAEEVGNVTLRKDVVEEEQTIDVPVRHEEVEVSRTPVDRPAQAGDAFQQDEVSVPVQAERVEVTKTPRVVEEVELNKVAREERRPVTETVRREEVDVAGTGDASVRQSGGSGVAGKQSEETLMDEDTELNR